MTRSICIHVDTTDALPMLSAWIGAHATSILSPRTAVTTAKMICEAANEMATASESCTTYAASYRIGEATTRWIQGILADYLAVEVYIGTDDPSQVSMRIADTDTDTDTDTDE